MRVNQGVTTNVKKGQTVSGFPAQDHRKELKLQALIHKLPDIYSLLKQIKKDFIKK